jgi:short-subunit dehydrogenase involved in D-alanine esterification of teichoic acids
VYFQADLAVPDEIERLVTRVRKEFGSPTVLVNNAGVQFNHAWPETDAPDRWAWAQTETKVNLLAPLGLTALFLDDLASAPEAAVVNITSILAFSPKRSAPVYSATKAAMRSFSDGLRYQLEESPNVRVVEVVPPLVDTDMTAGRGSGKMDPAQAAEAIVRGLEDGRDEIWLGKARVIRTLQRFLPGAARKILKGG